MTPSSGYSETLNRRVRLGNRQDQQRSTWEEVAHAMDRDDPADAAAFGEHRTLPDRLLSVPQTGFLGGG